MVSGDGRNETAKVFVGPSADGAPPLEEARPFQLRLAKAAVQDEGLAALAECSPALNTMIAACERAVVV